MNEITRASHADRKRYSEHIAEVYALGYIDDAEAEKMRAKVLQAKEVSQLRKVFSGMPAVREKTPKSKTSPGYFVPRLLASGVLSLLLATIPHSYNGVIPAVAIVVATVLGCAGASASILAMIIMLGMDHDRLKERMKEMQVRINSLERGHR